MARALCESLARHGRSGRTIGIKVRLDDWTTVTRARTIAAPTRDAELGRRRGAARCSRDYAPPRPVRLLGVRVAGARGRATARAPAPTRRAAEATAPPPSQLGAVPRGIGSARWHWSRVGDDRARLRTQRRRPAAAADHGHERHRPALGRAVPRAAAARLRRDRLRPPRRRRQQPPGGADHDRRRWPRTRPGCSRRSSIDSRARAGHLDGRDGRPGARARRTPSACAR